MIERCHVRSFVHTMAVDRREWRHLNGHFDRRKNVLAATATHHERAARHALSHEHLHTPHTFLLLDLCQMHHLVNPCCGIPPINTSRILHEKTTHYTTQLPPRISLPRACQKVIPTRTQRPDLSRELRSCWRSVARL